MGSASSIRLFLLSLHIQFLIFVIIIIIIIIIINFFLFPFFSLFSLSYSLICLYFCFVRISFHAEESWKCPLHLTRYCPCLIIIMIMIHVFFFCILFKLSFMSYCVIMP